MHRTLDNVVVQELSWTGVTVSVSNRRSKEVRAIVQNVNGNVRAGELLAIMGPSGSGKTTLLNALAHRPANANTRISSQVLINRQRATASHFRNLSRFVEAEDNLIGALTVRETLFFAAKLGLGASISSGEREDLVEEMLQVFGLVDQAGTIVGTLVKRGISTGQKRRLSVAARLISAPRILFLDEPTSGLDSAASFKVVSYLRIVARTHNILVVCSIHQPSSTTFELFDKTLIMSGGRSCYFGRVDELAAHLNHIGHPMPTFINPADFVLDLINVDFETSVEVAHAVVAQMHKSWEVIELELIGDAPRKSNSSNMNSPDRLPAGFHALDATVNRRASPASIWESTLAVIHRGWIKSRRDVMVYGIRLAMYLGFGVLAGTVWLRLPDNQDSIVPLAHCILFIAAFTSFMAVVYVPAFIEDYQVFVMDRSNGLYGATAFLLANTLIGLPYLFLLAFIPSTFVYWMVNFRPDGTAFMIWVLWGYLNLLAAESLVVLVSALLPNFIGALAAFAFLNSVLMACNGFMVPRAQLNVFYRYVFYYVNYQGYVYRGLSRNEFAYRDYDCGNGCQCLYATPLAVDCKVAGTAVLQNYGFQRDRQGVLIGIMIGIIAGTRVLSWIALQMQRK